MQRTPTAQRRGLSFPGGQIYSVAYGSSIFFDQLCSKRAIGPIGVAAPGSKKTPVQQELTQCFREVLTKKPFLAENAGDGQQLLWSGGNQAAFLKQLRLNEGYMVMMIDELVNFFDVNFPQNGTTNANSYIIPTTLLPLRTGDGIAKSLSSDLKNQVDSTQVAMSFMGQDRHEKRQAVQGDIDGQRVAIST